MRRSKFSQSCQTNFGVDSSASTELGSARDQTCIRQLKPSKRGGWSILEIEWNRVAEKTRTPENRKQVKVRLNATNGD